MAEQKVMNRWFVVVGAAHLVGEAGLPDLMREQGFAVEQVRPAATEAVPAATVDRVDRGDRAVVYFPACVSRIMGPAAGDPLLAAFVLLLFLAAVAVQAAAGALGLSPSPGRKSKSR